MPAWYYAGVVGACGWRSNDGDRVAEHAHTPDRFAREIVGFLKVIGGALAAADANPLGRNRTLVEVQWVQQMKTTPADMMRSLTSTLPDEVPVPTSATR